MTSAGITRRSLLRRGGVTAVAAAGGSAVPEPTETEKAVALQKFEELTEKMLAARNGISLGGYTQNQPWREPNLPGIEH